MPQIEKQTIIDTSFIISPLNNSIADNLSRTVFGYLPYWEYSNSKSLLRYDLLTHIALFSFSTNADGSINNPPGGQWPWTDVINEAHQNNVKVLMCVINFDVTESEMHNIITNTDLTLNFIESVKSKIISYSLDGINIDFEASNIAPSDRGANINNFMKTLSDSVHALSPDLEVSFASPPVNWDSYWNLEGLAESCDYLFVMGYDFYGSWSSNTGPTAPLVSKVSNYHITNTIDSQYQNITNNNPEKLILGVPYFGPHWIANGEGEGAETILFVDYERFRTAEPQSKFYELQWSDNFKNSWYGYNDGNNFRQIWYDNDSSLALKYDLAISHNLKGVGIWALGYDGDRSELWNLIDYKFGSGELPVPQIPINFNVIVIDNNSVKLEFSYSNYAESYEIYSSTDGQHFSLLTEVTTNSFLLDTLKTLNPYYYKIRAKNAYGSSEFSEVLGGIPSTSKILIINGFDEQGDTNNTFDFIRYYSEPMINLGLGFSSSSNEAVFDNKVKLNDFDVVFWILLSEGSFGDTFNKKEQEKVKSFLENGGNLFVSGSDLGWDLIQNGDAEDIDFYANYLKAIYIGDAPLNQISIHYSVEPVLGEIFEGLDIITFDDGTHGSIDVSKPDAISSSGGASIVMKYTDIPSSSGAAGLAYSGPFRNSLFEGKLIYFTFPFETIIDVENRKDLMIKIAEYFKLRNVINLKMNKYIDNPILTRGENGSWNDVAIGSPSVIFDGEFYHMWYNGSNGSTANIGYASSIDKINWEVLKNPVLENGPDGSWDNLFVLHPSVYFDGSLYHMWYTGNDGSKGQIGYATSPDSINWTKYSGNPVLTTGSSGEWDDVSINTPEVLFIDSIFYMWYSGNDGSVTQIGLVTSHDGINWNKEDLNPVLKVGESGDWDNTMSFSPSILFDGSTYHMWYAGGSEFKWNIGYAYSGDGRNWIKDNINNPILLAGEAGSWDSEYVGYQSVIYGSDSTDFDMWYTGASTSGYIGTIGFASTNIDLPASFNKRTNQKSPDEYLLSQNYPNPFNPITTIKYSISPDLRYEYQDVRMVVYDVLGREIKTLVNQKQKSGNYEVQFDASTNSATGSNLTSGVYIYQLQAGDYVDTKKMILLK